MKTTLIKTILLTILIPLLSSFVYCQQTEIIKWQSGVSDRIYASPAVIGDKIYIGSEDGKIYCKDLESGRSYYQYQTGSRIASVPVVYGEYLILVSGNDLICFDPQSMSEKWRFLAEAHPDLAKLDEWDYHHSSPIIHSGVVYYGCGNGVLYGVNPENGQQVFSWSANEYSPIRSTPTIADDILYFGDWEGVMYAVDLNENELKWSTRTWAGIHYDNFAGILSHIEVGEDRIYYGARNHIIHSLNKSDGTIAWTYQSPEGGWISGDPVLQNDRLYIAGSDNHKMLCFNSTTGLLLWDFQYPGNCLTKPLIVDDKIVFTTGNGYANSGQNYGRGFIHTLNLPDGDLFYEHELPGNVFSSPVLHQGTVYVGCDNKNLYALDASTLLGITSSSIGSIDYPIGKGAVSKFRNYPNPFNKSTYFEFVLAEPGDVVINITDLNGREISSFDLPGLSEGKNGHELFYSISAHSLQKRSILFAQIIHNGIPVRSLSMIGGL